MMTLSSRWLVAVGCSLQLAMSLVGCGGQTASDVATKTNLRDPSAPPAFCPEELTPASLRQVAEGVTEAALGGCGHVAYQVDGSLFLTSQALEPGALVTPGAKSFGFSSGDRYLLAQTEGGTVVRDLRDGSTRTLDGAYRAQDTVIGRDGAEFALRCDSQGMSRADLASGDVTTIDSGACHHFASFGPVGVGIIGLDTTRTLRVFDANQGAATSIALEPMPEEKDSSDKGWSEFLFVTADGSLAAYERTHSVAQGDAIMQDKFHGWRFDLSTGQSIDDRADLGIQFATGAMAVFRSHETPQAKESFLATEATLRGPVPGEARDLLRSDAGLSVIFRQGLVGTLVDATTLAQTPLGDHVWDIMTSDGGRAAALTSRTNLSQPSTLALVRDGLVTTVTQLVPEENVDALTDSGVISVKTSSTSYRLIDDQGVTLGSSSDRPQLTTAGARVLASLKVGDEYITSVLDPKQGTAIEIARSKQSFRSYHHRGIALVFTSALDTVSQSSPKTLLAGALP